jgi:AcrR family transcriptional regulator
MKDKKIEKDKETRLLDTAFKLFTEKGITDTSIQEIVDNANVAKGTFYTYFKDKYEIRDVLISRKASKLFNEAVQALKNNYISNFPDQVIFVINYVIDELNKTPSLLKFIAKNLSWGIYNQTVHKLCEDSESNENGFYKLFLDNAKEYNLKDPEITLFMIVELVSSTCYHSILYQKPIAINDFKPYLYETIRDLIENNKNK